MRDFKRIIIQGPVAQRMWIFKQIYFKIQQPIFGFFFKDFFCKDRYATKRGVL